MQETNAMRDRLMNEFAENYMEKLFYFCLKKTGSHIEAEDLTQDVALQIITALNKGTIPASFSAWVWQIARNRYALWAKKKHSRNDMVTGDHIENYEIEDESENILEELVHKEQLALLRRELAFIKSDYRNIVVAYYIENKSVREISSSLSLSESTVKSKLFRARQILKEGMDMAREFGKRSYKPEEIFFSMSGRNGMYGQPWTIVNHKLYKNIILEANENPQTAEELSLELGIALPYMEDELDYLVREQLLIRIGNKYQTAFPIISKDEQRKKHETNLKVQKALTDKICELIDTYVREDGSKVNCEYIGYDAAKWALLVRVFDYLQRAYNESVNNNTFAPCPERPDEGAWILTGFETIDWKKPHFVGKHGYRSYDENEIKKDVDYWQYKFQIYGINEKTPEFLNWQEAYTLWLVCCGRLEACERAYIDKLLEYVYLKKDDSIVPNVLIFNNNAVASCDERVSLKLSELKNEIIRLFGQAPEITRGYIVEQALNDGWLKYDDKTPNTIGAYIGL